MLLYNVTYPHSAECDTSVPWSYLETLTAVGAVATCTNGPDRQLVLTRLNNRDEVIEALKIEENKITADDFRLGVLNTLGEAEHAAAGNALMGRVESKTVLAWVRSGRPQVVERLAWVG